MSSQHDMNFESNRPHQPSQPHIELHKAKIEGTASFKYVIAGFLENVFFCSLGMPYPKLVDYLTDLYVNFAVADKLYGADLIEGKCFKTIIDEISQLASVNRETDLWLRINQHLGDRILLTTGLFPDAMRLETKNSAISLVDYVQQGKHCYREVANYVKDETLYTLSDKFELVSFGLREAQKEILPI